MAIVCDSGSTHNISCAWIVIVHARRLTSQISIIFTIKAWWNDLRPPVVRDYYGPLIASAYFLLGIGSWLSLVASSRQAEWHGTSHLRVAWVSLSTIGNLSAITCSQLGILNIACSQIYSLYLYTFTDSLIALIAFLRAWGYLFEYWPYFLQIFPSWLANSKKLILLPLLLRAIFTH